MMFDKMVIALDGSQLSPKVQEAAILFARENKSSLTFVHVVKELPAYVTSQLVFMVHDVQSEYLGEAKKYGQELLDQACEAAEKEGVQCEAILLQGDPANELLALVKEKNADLIMMGSRGLGDFKELMLGSVSHRITQLAPCPVFIIK
ncbi:universal stress protein [Brevibacillus sp. 7WMA2]|uniref:universal stress protein n=1 Tax=Brevibacillus TaxID=55080 RepID=UPI000EB332C0|nr:MULTISPECIES: universal stress protein [Brevibacillus]AYK06387.1 universal stress protein [Brevibacillus laterosporus]MBA4533996.1 universal stress protein [Brevibacillus halotolerans]MCR8996351.1 universal stress protein [Brevibacillus laterosporus]QIC07258.1 universal stress protein [Brevibacillus sp. 7WMA2]